MDRRGAIIAGAGLGLAGLAAARPDQQYYPAAGGAQIPGSRTGKIRASQVIITSGAPNTGLFVYNGTPALGNSPVFSVVAPGVHADPYGNPVDNIMAVGNEAGALTQIDGAGEILMYSPTTAQVIVISPVQQAMFVYSAAGAGAGTMIASIAVNAGTDSFGNQFLAGFTEYAPGSSAIQLLNGQLNFYSFTTSWQLDQADVGFQRTLLATDTYILKFGVSPVFLASLTGVTVNQPLAVNSGETVTGGLTADTETITSAHTAASALLEIINTATSNTPILRLTTNALGDLLFGARVAGDTNSRIVMDVTAGGVPRIRFGPGNAAPDAFITRPSVGTIAISAADLDISTVGRGLKIATGANARMGSATLVAGTVTVANTTIQGTDFIFLSRASPGGTLGQLSPGSVTVGTSFVINSSNAGDTSLVNWLLIAPG